MLASDQGAWQTGEVRAIIMRDEDYYGLAALEITERRFDHPLMAKAFAHALGNANKTRALYIRMRADQLKKEATTLAREARKRERLQRAEEQAAKEVLERKLLAAEQIRRKEEEVAHRRKQELEAQRAGDAWEREATVQDRWSTSQSYGSGDTKSAESQPTKPSQRSSSMSPEELDKIVEALKKSQNAKSNFY